MEKSSNNYIRGETFGVFQNDLRTGEIGEEFVLDYLKKFDSLQGIYDVRNDELFQKADIDFLVSKPDLTIIPIEVKTDTMAHRTGNIAYEVYSNKDYKTKGCFEKTGAKFIFYFLTETKDLYMIDVWRLRKMVADEYKGKRKMIAMGDNALGFLIKIKDLETRKIAVNLTN